MNDYLIVAMIGNKLLNFSASTEAMTMDFMNSFKQSLVESLEGAVEASDIVIVNVVKLDTKQGSIITNF